MLKLFKIQHLNLIITPYVNRERLTIGLSSLNSLHEKHEDMMGKLVLLKSGRSGLNLGSTTFEQVT